jgi:CubicO group peptidase (beta-lactamase class C family)
MTASLEIHGLCHPKLARVKDAFAKEFADGNELGAGVALTLEGELVVDLWAGHQDTARTKPFERDTLVNVYSTTKGITAIALHRLVDEGKVDLDAPVARYWPEFAQAGKASLPVRYLLSHQAGLAAVRKPLPQEALFDWSAMTAALAAQAPWWEPGKAHGYHALTFGWLNGEVVRRVRGKKLGDVVRDEIARPLGATFEIGFGSDLDAQVAPLAQGPIHPSSGDIDFDLVKAVTENPEGLLAKAFGNPPVLAPGLVNSRAWRGAEIPGANGHSNAHSLARIYAPLANGGRAFGVQLLSKEAIERARTPQVDGRDEVLPFHTRIGLGFFLPTPEEPIGPNPRAFGHGGAGGSYSHADPEHRLSFGYAMNLMHTGAWLVDPRPRRLLAAAYASL